MLDYIKRISTLTLALLILASTAACGSAGSETEQTTASDSIPEVSSDTTADQMKDDLPNMTFDGYEFKIHRQERAWYHGTWIAEEETGDVLSDAVYKRNLDVSERFKIKISELASTSNNDARPLLLSGDDEYSIFHLNSGDALNYAIEGFFFDVSNLKYCDYTKGYWDKNINDALTIDGKRYFSQGASDLTAYDYTHVMLFNKEMIKDNNLKNPYELIQSGEWTLTAYDEMVKNVTRDVNGDTKMDENDVYGLLSQPKHVLPDFWVASDVRSINFDKNGNPVFNMASDEKFMQTIDRIFGYTHDNNSWFYYTSADNADKTLNNMFEANKGLFLDATFYYIESFRNMNADFGIIPFPKQDSAQEKYYSRVEGANFVCVPVSSGNLDRTSIILEALTCESAKTVIPAYYDIALKSKYTRDPESVEMLEIIFNSRIFDLGDTIWCSSLRDGVFHDMFKNNDRNLASKLASLQSLLDEKINTTIEAFKALG